MLISTTVISEPDDVTVCEGRSTSFTCVLNSTISRDDVQWYRLLKDAGTTEMVDLLDNNFTVSTQTRNTTNSSLTISNAIKSYTGYYWVRTSSVNVCNVSLNITTSMYINRTCICISCVHVYTKVLANSH